MQQPPQMMMMMQQQQAPPQQPSLPSISPDVATKQGATFDLYYPHVDKSRDKCSMFYKDWSAVIWNGTRITTVNAINNFFQNVLPSSTHTVFTVDAQLITSSLNNVAIYNILVSVNGLVEYGGDYRSKRYFTQYFVLHPELDNQQKMTLFIASDTFRWINPLPPMLAKPRGPKQFGGPQSSQYGQQPQQQQPQNMGRGQFVPDNQQFAPQGPVRGGFRGRSRGRGRGRGGRGRGNFNQGEGGAPPPQYN